MQHFKSNPYFTDSVLKKEYKYVPPPEAAGEQPDEDGLTPSMLAFVWARDVKTSVCILATHTLVSLIIFVQGNKIDWKNPENALTKLHPRMEDDREDSDVPAEAGSFFNFFEIPSDPFDVSRPMKHACGSSHSGLDWNDHRQ